MSLEGALPPCERFTILQSRPTANIARCDVCDQAEAAHPESGRRKLSGGEIEELRRRMLIETHERLEAERERHAADGQALSTDS